MRTSLVAVLLLWMCLSIEFARVSLIPPHCLVIPAACAVMLWLQNGTGVLIGGLALLLDWVAHPSTLPLTPLLIPPAAVMLMSTSRPVDRYRRRRLVQFPAAWRLPALTLFGLVLQLASEFVLPVWQEPQTAFTLLRHQIADATMFAIPVSVVFALIQHAANELGLRRVVIR